VQFAQRDHRGRVRGDGTERAGIVVSSAAIVRSITGVDIGDRPSAASSGPAISSARRFSVTMSTPAMPPRRPSARRVITPQVLVGTATVTGASGSAPFASAIAVGERGQRTSRGDQRRRDRHVTDRREGVSQSAVYHRGMHVRRATDDDRPALCVTAMRAFVDDPVMRWLYPEDDVFLAPGGEVLRAAMTGWIGLGEVWCTDDGVGAAVWIPPGRPEIDFTVDPPAPEPPPDRLERFAILGPLMEQHTPPEPHWYLQLWPRIPTGSAAGSVPR
jgi:hypothetical protein